MRKASYIAIAAAVGLTAAAIAAPMKMRRYEFPNKSLGKFEVVDAVHYYMGEAGNASGSKELPDTQWGVLRPLEDVVTNRAKWSSIPKNIEGFDFHDLEVDNDQVCGLVAGFPQIKWIWVTGADVDNQLFVKLPKLPHLVNLGAGHIPLTGVGLKQFTKFPNLQYLILTQTLVKDQDCASLLACPKIFELQMQHTQIGDKALEHIGKLPNLQIVNLSRTNVTAAGLASMSAARKSLIAICIYGTDIGDSGLAALSKFEKLAIISMSGLKKLTCSAKGIASLASLKSLRELDFNLSDVHDDVLLAIPAAVPQLEKIHLGDCKNITDAGFAGFERLKHITDMRAPASAAGDKLMKAAARWSQLHFLQSGTNASDAGLKALADAKSPVHILVLENCKVTDKGVPYLQSLPKLQVLSLSGTNITDASIPVLSKLKALEGLAIQNTKITAGGVEKLRAALPRTRVRD